MSTEKTTTINLRQQEAKKLFGFAVSIGPLELYNQIGRPQPPDLPDTAHVHIGSQYAQSHKYESGAKDLLLASLGQTQTFVLDILRYHPHTTFEKALEIATHEQTIRTLSILARQASIMSEAMLAHANESYHLSPDEQSIEIDSTISPNRHKGCHAVEIRGGKVESWPIFQRFAPWAAKLAIISYFDHMEV